MGNPKKDSKHFNPNHIGTKSRAFGGNKGKQNARSDKSDPSSDSNKRGIILNLKIIKSTLLQHNIVM